MVLGECRIMGYKLRDNQGHRYFPEIWNNNFELYYISWQGYRDELCLRAYNYASLYREPVIL